MKQKGKALKGFAWFLVLMFVCGMISRGIYARQMPRVATAKIVERELDHTVEGEGILEAKEEKPLLLPAGLLVAGIHVRKGQMVEEGDMLLTLDMESLQKLYKKKQEELALADTRLKDYESGVAREAQNRQRAIDRANEDYGQANSSGGDAVNTAQGAYQRAKDALNAFPSFKDYKEKEKERDETYQKLKEEAEKKDASDEEKCAFEDYADQFESSLNSRYEEEKQGLSDALAQREAELSGAKREQGEKILAAGRALEDAKEPLRVEEAAEVELRQLISDIKEEQGIYKEYLDKEGVVTAPERACVSAVLVEPGGMTGETGAVVLSTLGDTLYFTGNILKEEKKYVAPGDLMTISFGGRYVSDIPVLAIEEGEDGGYKVTAEISSQDRMIGENGTFSLVRKTDSYPECVPISAVYTENQENFVYYIEKQETILGTELVAKKRKVKVLDKDEKFAALDRGSFTEDELLIVGFDKEFETGTRVREEE